MKKNIPFVILLLLCCFCGCIQTSKTIITNDKKFQRLYPNTPVLTYLSEEEVPGFEEIGIIEINKSDTLTIYLKDVIEEAQIEARMIGANCIILLKDFLNEGNNKRNPNRYFFRAGYAAK